MRRPTRRAVLGWGGATGLVALGPVIGYGGWLYAGSGRSNVGRLSFRNRLRIPPLPAPTERNGRKTFVLRAQEGTAELLPGRRTRTWGYNGAHLGPTLRAARGDRVAIELTNGLGETTTTHWHGMRLPAVMDGGPHQPIGPGATWRPYWTVEQPAATLWYHPHLHRRTAAHVYRGMAGMFLVDDDGPDGLPGEYGVDDVPVIVQDKKFHDDGSLDDGGITFQGLSLTGLLGDTILVNGTYDPYLEVTRTHTRLRLLNASNARVYDIGFADDRPFWLVATDAGLTAAPQRMRRIMLSPGERAEIVVVLRPGERAVLRGHPPRMGANRIYERLTGGDDAFDLLQIRAAARLEQSPPLPARLAEPEPIPVTPRTLTREFVMGDFTLNGRTMDHGRIDQVVTAGSVEIWRVTNAGGFPANGLPHSFHVHEVGFQVLDVNGRPPAAHLRGRKDTVFVPPRTTMRLAMRFGRWSDPAHPYMYHCHLLAHEDAGMMGQFVVVSPRDRGRVRPPGGHH
ncbi:multicopper oxidase family protein [Thermomonospora cellulosilytica]|uniref:FtsP/CotA-like multicopper oxidase with cupredoxin domain n=1 Tax=Thermomonospora cellulosilytica TaxID=1411118 RepID=A0A7W3MVB8_9ACTN|nr:multicopper oxidase domain-containing protein [Thermomonospora cellulosilytica]MBA9002539.1 FtsP/CotA-like multicopper oxidase with cupredoxin domain [Thermomonospora cellulosilytica]